MDATSFVLMSRHKISHAFAFDHHFLTAGFRLVGYRLFGNAFGAEKGIGLRVPLVCTSSLIRVTDGACSYSSTTT